MNDDQMDDLLIQGAKDYNEPGAVPREEMWARLSAARQRGAPAPWSTFGRRKRLRTWAAVGVAAAAVLVLGIVIGRRLERPAASQPIIVAVTPGRPGGTPSPRRRRPLANGRVDEDSVIQQLRSRRRRTPSVAPRSWSPPRRDGSGAGLGARRQPRLPARGAAAPRRQRSHDHGVPVVGQARRSGCADRELVARAAEHDANARSVGRSRRTRP